MKDAINNVPRSSSSYEICENFPFINFIDSNCLKFFKREMFLKSSLTAVLFLTKKNLMMLIVVGLHLE